MCNLPQEDRVCFKCNLEDCKESNKDCPRKSFIKERDDYKKQVERQKMTSTLKRTEPIVVR